MSDFFAFERFKKRRVDYNMFLLKEFEERNLLKLFDHNFKAKYFKEIYMEDEESCIYHYYQLIHTSNIYKETRGLPIDDSDFELEFNLLNEYIKYEINNIKRRAVLNKQKNQQETMIY